ncbi:MAG: zinc ribbon-containing protein [Cycloclasticus sp.]
MTNPIQDKLVHAYDVMVERLHSAVEHAEKQTLPGIEEQLKKTQEKAIELGELTKDEAEKVGAYLKRDLDDISAYLQETQAEFSEWLSFESTLVESKIGDWLNLVADKTRLELDKLNLQAIKGKLYHSGEVTGPGTLQCIACDQTLNFKKTGHVPPCPKCHKTEFKRHSKKHSR